MHALLLRLGIALCAVLQAFPVALLPAGATPGEVSTDERFEAEVEAPESSSEASLAAAQARSATGRRAAFRPPPGEEGLSRVAGRRAESATPFSERRPPPYFPRPRKVLLRRLS